MPKSAIFTYTYQYESRRHLTSTAKNEKKQRQHSLHTSRVLSIDFNNKFHTALETSLKYVVGDCYRFEISKSPENDELKNLVLSSETNNTPYSLAVIGPSNAPGYNGINISKELSANTRCIEIILFLNSRHYTSEFAAKELSGYRNITFTSEITPNANTKQLATSLSHKWELRKHAQEENAKCKYIFKITTPPKLTEHIKTYLHHLQHTIKELKSTNIHCDILRSDNTITLEITTPENTCITNIKAWTQDYLDAITKPDSNNHPTEKGLWTQKNADQLSHHKLLHANIANKLSQSNNHQLTLSTEDLPTFNGLKGIFNGPTQKQKTLWMTYDQNDYIWAEKIKKHIASLVSWGIINLKEGIPTGLNQDEVLLILVSPNYLTSKTIHHQSLESLFDLPGRIIWAPIAKSLVEKTRLASYTPAWNKDEPLDSLPENKVNENIVRLCNELMRPPTNT